ncbi:DNA segregation ATPase FtsK/SpoIIIE-like protein [Paenibacillus mucilaginosus]
MNSIIVSLLFGNTPEDLKFVFIDPKRVELIAYQNLPHLMYPVITDMAKAGKALSLVLREMEERYEQFKELRVNNIQSYNEKIMLEEPEHSKMPYIVLVIDEFASLMLTAEDKTMENQIIRLSQEACAPGIHMILATQRPVAKVFSPTIKANLPMRISFMVTSSTESMVILDEPGAEGLLGKGDMYFKYRNMKSA